MVTYWRSMLFHLRERFCSILIQACGRLPYDLRISYVFIVCGVIIVSFFFHALGALRLILCMHTLPEGSLLTSF